jgi:hypothetical protein
MPTGCADGDFAFFRGLPMGRLTSPSESSWAVDAAVATRLLSMIQNSY